MRGIPLIILGTVMAPMLLAGCETSSEPDLDSLSTPIVGGWIEAGMESSLAILEYGDPVCSGTLVDSRLVVTAGHCVFGVSSPLQVFFGVNANRPGTGQVVDVDSYTIHPNFNYNTLDADIAVMELAADAPVTPSPMLPAGVFDNSWVGQPLRFVGYGSTNWYGNGSGRKRAVDIDVDAVDADTFTFYDSTHQTCYGDSGGGAFAEYDGQYQLIGVTSYGDYYCDTYGVDTRVDAYLTWVEGFMGGGGNPGTGTELIPGALDGGTLALGDTDLYYFDTTANYQYDVLMYAPADADLYTHPTDDIDLGTYTCRPYYVAGEVEVCTISGAGAGSYHALVHGAEATGYDILVVEAPEACRQGFNGQARHCRNNCPCGYGMGSCRNDDQCADGLVCAQNAGADFGLNPNADICVLP